MWPVTYALNTSCNRHVGIQNTTSLLLYGTRWLVKTTRDEKSPAESLETCIFTTATVKWNRCQRHCAKVWQSTERKSEHAACFRLVSKAFPLGYDCVTLHLEAHKAANTMLGSRVLVTQPNWSHEMWFPHCRRRGAASCRPRRCMNEFAGEKGASCVRHMPVGQVLGMRERSVRTNRLLHMLQE